MYYGRAEPLFLIIIVFLALAWISGLLRAWVKVAILRKIALDDYLMLAAILFYSGYSAAGIVGVMKGLGMIQTGLTAAETSIGLHSWWLCEVLYAPVTLTGRTSVALFLLQIAVQKRHRRIIFGVVIAFWVTTIPLLVVMIFQCHPISYFWMQPIAATPRGTCLNSRILFFVSVVHSAITACCDWTLGAMPIVMLWNVQLNKRTKFTLSLLLGMGFFAGIALIVRIIYVKPFSAGTEFLYESINLADWSILEPGVCIIAGCIATYRPLFSRFGFAGRSRTYRTPGSISRYGRYGRYSRGSRAGSHFDFGSTKKTTKSGCANISHRTHPAQLPPSA